MLSPPRIHCGGALCGSARAAQAWVTKDEPDDEGVDGAHAIVHAAQRHLGATKHGMQKRAARSEAVQRRWRGRSDGSGDGRDDGVQDVWRCDTGLRVHRQEGCSRNQEEGIGSAVWRASPLRTTRTVESGSSSPTETTRMPRACHPRDGRPCLLWVQRQKEARGERNSRQDSPTPLRAREKWSPHDTRRPLPTSTKTPIVVSGGTASSPRLAG